MTTPKPITDLERRVGRGFGFSDEQILKARGMSRVSLAPDGDPAAAGKSAEQRRLQREADRLSALIAEQDRELDRLETRLQGVRGRATTIAPQTETIAELERQIRDCRKERSGLAEELAAILDQLATPEEKAVARAGRLPLAQVVRARTMAKLDGPNNLPPNLPLKPSNTEVLNFDLAPSDTEIEMMRVLGWSMEQLKEERRRHEMENLKWGDPKKQLRGKPAVHVTLGRPGVRIVAQAPLIPQSLINELRSFERFVARL
jgi:uncharacterized coiled-coil protein SlyX